MNFLKKLNPFYWKHVADKCNALTTELVNKNVRLTQQNVALQQENRSLCQKIEQFNMDIADRMKVSDSELAKRIANGEVSSAEAKLLLDIRLLRDETDNANTYAKYAQETSTEEQQKVATLQAQLDAEKAISAKLRAQNNKWFELIAGVGVDEGVMLTASHRGKTLVLDAPDVEEK